MSSRQAPPSARTACAGRPLRSSLPGCLTCGEGQPGLPRAPDPGYRRSFCSSRPPQQAGIGHRVLLYRRGGDSTVTGNVTWLSPAACDPGKWAADMPQGTRRGGQAMRVLVTEDDEILATALAAGLRRE